MLASYMNTQLKTDSENLNGILNHTVDVALKHFDRQDTLPPGRYIPDIQMEDLALNGIGADATLTLFEERYAPLLANSTGSKYFAFVTGGSTPASVAGDWLVSAYDQNACGSNDSIAPQIERQTIHYLKQMFGLDSAFFGSFVSGATMASFSGLALARQWFGEQLGHDFSMEGITATPKIFSGTPHSSILKSLSMLGIGRKSLVYVPTLADREAIDIEALEDALKQHHAPCIVVANAGTVNTVDFDNLEAIGQLKTRYKLWLHVDAAFGGFAATSEKYKHLMNGINYADSITIDAHKWLNVPYDSAMQFCRHKDLQLKVFQNNAAYLTDPEKSPDYFHYTPENSRRFRALPAWFTLKAYGLQGHREIVERNCDAAQYLGELISKSDNFRLLAPVRMNVTCFTIGENPTQQQIKTFLEAVRDDGRVFFTQTVYKGSPGIRAAISNWRTTREDMDIAFQVLQTVYQKFALQPA